MTQAAKKAEIRDIIEINEDLCNGCGQCLSGCAEGALALVNGKAKLVSDIYCDGLGACLGHCPTGALKVIKRQAPDFDEEAAMARVRQLEADRDKQACGCPGSRAMKLADNPAEAEAPANGPRPQLAFWPIQLKLAPPSAPAFDNPVLVLAADCTGFTGPDFHRTFLTEKHPLVMACPKLDDLEPNIEKLAAIFKAHPAISELRVPMMSVPCCGGLGYMAAEAIKRAGRDGEIKVRTWIITPEGRVTEEVIR
ncbi:4Fe-4S ferredoxin [Deltaproteobacteria bacterium OttesenSCG-928-K17]|nr:4Fe-4S ferredoxin [Deltaproteobacteria bacterium OttesenSCG-928-K17]